ncbi:MAG: heme exporter protein CcmD [Chania sp.]
MNTAFDSWQAFFAMGGYAFYVWLAVAATLLSLLGLLVHTLWQRKQLLNEVGRRQARERRIRQSQQSKQPTAVQSAEQRGKSL